jgi:cell division protein FtsI (penicillin-binding protein 3)
MDPLQIELPEKGMPILPKRWSDTNLISNSFGYEISVTPVHVITAISAMVNGGILRPATIIATDKPAEGVRVLSEENSKKMREMLRYVVLEGTGKWADVAGYEVGGKTGTAEKVVNGKYDKKTVRATFVSVFPSTNPKYAMLVMFDEPKAEAGVRGRTAGANAVPATKRILEKIAPQLNVVPDFAINSAREAVLSVALNF